MRVDERTTSYPAQGDRPVGVAVITGATSGIGLAMALSLARRGWSVVVAGRNREKTMTTASAISGETGNPFVQPLLCDLAAMDSIRGFVCALRTAVPSVDLLINNAGVINPHRKETIDGFEETFAVNYLGPFLLSNLLADRLVASSQGRLINIGSSAQARGSLNFDDFHAKRRYSCIRAYNQSKLALVLFTYSMARKLSETKVTVNYVHPGIVHSNIWPSEPLHLKIGSAVCRLLAISSEEAARCIVDLVTAPSLTLRTGKYFNRDQPKASKRISYDQDLQDRLWKVTAELCKVRE